ncbi:hypothetical protein WOLCODRAFT_30510, partial [Wolfiporia cocos MD-104 SS10]
IGGPVTFHTGKYAGRTLRAELEELQKADLGRKYGRKDRRPLDPPPVVQFRLFEVLDAGTPRQREREFDCYDELDSFGVVCHVDLYPVPDEEDDTEPGGGTRPPSPAFAIPPQQQHPYSRAQPAPYPPAPPYATPPLHVPPRPSPYSSPTYSPRSPPPPPRALAADPDAIAHLDGFAIRESTKCTGALAGATFVQSVVLDHKGRRALMFVFSDLAVKLEGSFVLRYRVFDLFSKANGGPGAPVLAECFGGPFKIYSTKEFPGLRASTDLTKHLSLYGVRLNLRENERKRRKK